MTFFLVHLLLLRLVRLIPGRSAAAALELENAVLRHQLRVLRRTVKRPVLRRRDPWGAKTRSCRWGEFVFVDETAEEVAAVHAC